MLDLNTLARLEVAIAKGKQNELNSDDIMTALVELGEMIAEQDDALVELAELIED